MRIIIKESRDNFARTSKMQNLGKILKGSVNYPVIPPSFKVDFISALSKDLSNVMHRITLVLAVFHSASNLIFNLEPA